MAYGRVDLGKLTEIAGHTPHTLAMITMEPWRQATSWASFRSNLRSKNENVGMAPEQRSPTAGCLGRARVPVNVKILVAKWNTAYMVRATLGTPPGLA